MWNTEKLVEDSVEKQNSKSIKFRDFDPVNPQKAGKSAQNQTLNQEKTIPQCGKL